MITTAKMAEWYCSFYHFSTWWIELWNSDRFFFNIHIMSNRPKLIFILEGVIGQFRIRTFSHLSCSFTQNGPERKKSSLWLLSQSESRLNSSESVNFIEESDLRNQQSSERTRNWSGDGWSMPESSDV